MRFPIAAVWASFALVLCSCSDSDDPKQTDAALPDTGPAKEASVNEAGSDGATSKCTIGEAINACTSGTCKAEKDCSPTGGSGLAGTCVSKQCVPDPKNDAKAKKGSTFDSAPDLTCLTTAPKLPSGPAKATAWGPVTTFGMNAVTTGLKVEIFAPGADPGLKTALGSVTSAEAKAKGTCSSACTGGKLCMYGKCVSAKDSQGNKTGFWEIKDIPTNKLLAFRVSGTGFVSTVQYNLWVRADKVTKDGAAYEEAYVISDLTKKLIPASAGIAEIAKGNGAVAGEVHDCNDDMVKGATVSFSLRPQKVVYFASGLPNATLTETTEDSVYAGLNIAPGTTGDITVTAAVKVGGKVTEIGQQTIRLFADQIVILTTTPWYPGKSTK